MTLKTCSDVVVVVVVHGRLKVKGSGSRSTSVSPHSLFTRSRERSDAVSPSLFAPSPPTHTLSKVTVQGHHERSLSKVTVQGHCQRSSLQRSRWSWPQELTYPYDCFYVQHALWNHSFVRACMCVCRVYVCVHVCVCVCVCAWIGISLCKCTFSAQKFVCKQATNKHSSSLKDVKR